MSIMTELLHRKIGWDEAKAKAEAWEQALVASHPAISVAVSAAVSAETAVVKQGASDAITLGETVLADHAAELTDALEAALETFLAKATGGASIGFNPIIDAFVTRTVDMAAKAAAAWGLETKAKLAAVPAVPPA